MDLLNRGCSLRWGVVATVVGRRIVCHPCENFEKIKEDCASKIS